MSEALQQPQQNKGVIRISLIAVLTVWYMAQTAMPVVGYYTPAAVRLGVVGLLSFALLPMLRRKGAWIMLGYFGVSLLGFVSHIIQGQEVFLYTYGILQNYLFGLIALYFIAKKGKAACRQLFWIWLCMFLITAATTISGNGVYPQASRELATLSNKDAVYDVYTKANIGGFDFAYEIVLLTPLVIFMIRKKIIKPILGYGMLFLLGWCIVAMEYGMATILFFVSLLLLVLPKLTTKRLVVILLITLLLVLLCTNPLAGLLEDISHTLDSDTLAERIRAVAEVLRSDDKVSSTTAQNRRDLYAMAWTAFVDSSFLGVWGKTETGGHSFVLDAMGQYGILGIAAVILLVVTIYKICLAPYKGQEHFPYILWSGLIGIFLMVMNPKTYIGIFLFIIPLVAEGFTNDERGDLPDESSLDRK